MKKKRTLIITLLLAVLAIGAFAFSPPTSSPPTPDKERSFEVSIPAHLVGAFYNTFNGNLQNVSVQDYKEVTQIITEQIAEQATKYQYEDSLLSIKMKAKASSTDTSRAGPPSIKNK